MARSHPVLGRLAAVPRMAAVADQEPEEMARGLRQTAADPCLARAAVARAAVIYPAMVGTAEPGAR